MSANFGVLVGLRVTWFSEEMLISNIFISGFMCAAIKKSWMVSNTELVVIWDMDCTIVHEKNLPLVFQGLWHYPLLLNSKERNDMWETIAWIVQIIF